MEIIHTNDYEGADRLGGMGWEPVECSFGSYGSVVGPLEMDHHGKLSHLEGVALRAYRDYFGARRGNAQFVVTGAADADACFCIAALAGILPHPSREGEYDKAPPLLKAVMTRDVTSLAELIGRVDIHPIGVRLEETEEGCLLLLWNQLAGHSQDALEFYAGVARWRSLLSPPPGALLRAAGEGEAERVKEAREAKFDGVSSEVAVVESSCWGFDVWYAEIAPIIVALTPQGNVTVGCQDQETVTRLLGPEGFKSVWPLLKPEGWGGRETIGGSPRGKVMTHAETMEAAWVIADKIKREA